MQQVIRERSQEELKQELTSYIDYKYEELFEKSNELIQTFHFDLIRQFEIQKRHLESIITEYMLQDAEEDEEIGEPDRRFIVTL